MKLVKKIEQVLDAYYETFKHWFAVYRSDMRKEKPYESCQENRWIAHRVLRNLQALIPAGAAARTERRSFMRIVEDTEVLEARRYTTFRFWFQREEGVHDK